MEYTETWNVGCVSTNLPLSVYAMIALHTTYSTYYYIHSLATPAHNKNSDYVARASVSSFLVFLLLGR